MLMTDRAPAAASASLEPFWDTEEALHSENFCGASVQRDLHHPEGLRSLYGLHRHRINDLQKTTTQFTIQPPASGTRVWLLWDLTYEFMIVRTGLDDPIPAGTYRGDVDFSDDDHYSGAYLNYRWTHLTVSAGILCPQDRVFA